MADLITANEIPGASVYGVKQVEYTVDGEDGKDYAAALTAAAFRESTAIEEATSAYSAVVRERMRKVDDLGTILAHLSEANAKLKAKSQSKDDQATVANGHWVNTTAQKYGITLVFVENTSNMTRANIMRGQNDVQYALDVEDNNLQQDAVSLQSFISKRDNAYSTASKIVKKAVRTAGKMIGNIE